jgi:hypothetical protein
VPEPTGWFNGPYTEAPESVVNRSAGLGEGGPAKPGPPMHEADAENLMMATSSRELPPVGDHCDHAYRHLEFLKSELAQSLPEAAIDRIVAHIKRHVDAARPYTGSRAESGLQSAGKLARLVMNYGGGSSG